MQINKDCFLKRLEADLQEYEQIILVMNEKELLEELLEIINEVNIRRQIKKKILILSAEQQQFRTNSEYSILIYRKITKTEAQMLDNLYHLYEFSNRFHVFSQENSYGKLHNLIDTGLLQKKELWEVILR